MKQTKLIELRNQFGLTQQDIVKVLGISEGAYSQKETGKRGFNQKEMSLIFTIFKAHDPHLNMQDIFLV